MTHLTISGNNASRIFHVLPGNSLVVKDMALKNATSATNGGAIFMEGNLTLENMLLQNNFENGLHRGITIISPGLVLINKTVNINQ